jgi:uncharacterized membrane protein
MKIDWKRKLTSRKFWMAIIGFLTPLLIALGVSEMQTGQIAMIVMAGASCIAYVIGEGLVDTSAAKTAKLPAKEGATNEGD